MRLTILLGTALAMSAAQAVSAAPTLVGFAQLPAATFVAGPTSGQFITGANGIAVPFVNMQPVQGFSAILPVAGTTNRFQAMSDNGFGSKSNSADALLYVHDVTIDFRTAAGGSGGVTVNSSSTLSDPNARLGFGIVADRAFYPNGTGNIAVDSAITNGRLLTGADLDPESFRRVADGSYWFGDEFGPFLIHTDANFQVIGEAVSLPGVRSPDSPLPGTANLGSSRGFEGMALSPDGGSLYTLLEGTVAGDPARTLRINRFDVASAAFGAGQWSYKLDPLGVAIGDMTSIGGDRFIVLERDGGQGPSAVFKKAFLIDLSETDADGNLIKTELVDLMNLADPDDLNGDGSTVLTFPFTTIEEVLVIDANTILIGNDNNFPFSNGRTPGVADNNEFLLIRLDQALAVPEPASWAMMIGGFALAGAALRRRSGGAVSA